MTLIRTDLWNKEQERSRKDKRSNFERYLDDLLKMIPDKYDRQEHRKDSKKGLNSVESHLSSIERYSRQLEELKKGLVKETEHGLRVDSQGMIFTSESNISNSLEYYKENLPTRVSIFKNNFEFLVKEIKEEISDIERYFERELFSKFPEEDND